MTQAKGKALNWDGKSRVSNDTYRQNWNDIFKKDNKRTYQKKIDHSNDITFENEINKPKVKSETRETKSETTSSLTFGE